MVGAGINVIPFMIQRSVPGIGPHVLPAFALATIPVLLAALAYAILASAMPRAGGTYIYASRGLHPYLGFVASFSQWFALCVAIGVVSYVLVPFLRDIALTAGFRNVAEALERGPVRLVISLAVLWAAVGVNLRGITLYERLVVPLMFLTFALGGIVIVADVMSPEAGLAEDVTDLLGFAAKEGFLPAALLGLARTFFSDYRRMRRTLGLARYTEREFLSLLTAGGFRAEILPHNPGPNRHRTGFRGIKA